MTTFSPNSPRRHLDSPRPDRVLMDVGELSRMLDVSTRTLWRLLSAGQLVEPIKLGGSTRWRRSDVESWIEAGCPAPSSDNKKGRD